MKFSYSVIGDNTQENREWLEQVGYAKHGDYRKWEDNLITFLGDDGKWYYTSAIWDIVEEFYLPFGSINCIGNSPLFKAVSAIREDSDYGQWFMCQTSRFTQAWYLCESDNYIQWAKKQKPFLNSLVLAHKATLTELQERFKDKKR